MGTKGQCPHRLCKPGPRFPIVIISPDVPDTSAATVLFHELLISKMQKKRIDFISTDFFGIYNKVV